MRWIYAYFLAALILAPILMLLNYGQANEEVEISGGALETGTDEMTKVKRYTFDDLYNDTFAVLEADAIWVTGDVQDGIFTYRHPESHDIMIESIANGSQEVLLAAKDMVIKGKSLKVDSYQISADQKYVMLLTNTTEVWRYSSRSNIYVYSTENKLIFPLLSTATGSVIPPITYAKWSPTGHQMAYVMNNDIYVTDLRNTTRVTYDGGLTILNGVPDWVYEEEVFEQGFALWWSPDSTHLAYLRFNETSVQDYSIPLYTVPGTKYPQAIDIKYPKAGSANPVVTLHIHSLLHGSTALVTATTTSAPGAGVQYEKGYQGFEDTNRLITQVVWATKDHRHLLFKQMNRAQDHELTSLVAIGSPLNQSLVISSRDYRPADGGWIDIGKDMIYIPNASNTVAEPLVRYIDVVDNEDGYTHLAIFEVKGKDREPHWLTTGEWEVVAGSVVLDAKRGIIHFISTEKSPTERHLYSISLDDPAASRVCRTCFENESIHAYYSAVFSPRAGYYLLSYEGPGIPETHVRSVDDALYDRALETNKRLKDALSDYVLPQTRMVTVETKTANVTLSALEILPVNFDPTHKYPVVFNVYGGPGSQQVTYRFTLDWHTYLASQLDYIVVMVDSRGTGFRGRDYRTCVRGRLGDLEVEDQIMAARHWADLQYIDKEKMAIWGWSYGGYVTNKVVEAGQGVFSTAMAVAPVADWLYYDSIYTERYMKLPHENRLGYERSAVNNMTGFGQVHYLLVHGTGDDNVHFQNAAILVDKLNQASIHNYRTQFYPDSDHNIDYHNSNRQVYRLLTDFLIQSFNKTPQN
ncbi:dipeptidyl peptidase IV N-terminal region-domain-containing protein [Dichotomocladium elegans]|nr:dipeptidyl peptidase IV N-terminal region-domain-containing protein [Dichotomocladium elegans]